MTEKVPKNPITAVGRIYDKRFPMHTMLHPSAALDPRGELAKRLIEASFIAPKYNGLDKPAELIDPELLVVRAFDAADLFYKEANFRDCLVPLPTSDEVDAANAAERERHEAARATAA